MISSDNYSPVDIISKLYINTASFEKEYAWYSVESTGLINELQDVPTEYEIIYKRDFTRNRSLILFTVEQNVCVYWGRDNLMLAEEGPKGDWMGRALGYTALIVFNYKEDALEFYAGLLRHWWLFTSSTKSPISEFTSQISLVPEADEFSVVHLRPVITDLLIRWRTEPVEELINEILFTRQPLIALESTQRIYELVFYIRHTLIHPEASLPKTKPIIVVAHILSISRLKGVLRALTDTTSELVPTPVEWTNNDFTIIKPEQIKRVDGDAESEHFLRKAGRWFGKIYYNCSKRTEPKNN